MLEIVLLDFCDLAQFRLLLYVFYQRVSIQNLLNLQLLHRVIENSRARDNFFVQNWLQKLLIFFLACSACAGNGRFAQVLKSKSGILEVCQVLRGGTRERELLAV